MSQFYIPKIRIRKVETSSPMVPVVRSASRMEIAELMTVLPKRRVHRRRLPCFRTARRKEKGFFRTHKRSCLSHTLQLLQAGHEL